MQRHKIGCKICRLLNFGISLWRWRFGLHCAKALQDKHQQEVELTGIEISPSAIQAATQSAQVLGLNNVKFQSLDAANFALALR